MNTPDLQQLSPEARGFLRAVSRRLNMPRAVKSRVVSDLATSISARIEQGEDSAAVLASLGTPAQAAADLNAQMQEFTYRRSPWRFVCLVLAALCALWLLVWFAPSLFSPGFSPQEAASLGIIGGADGPTSIIVTSQPSVLQPLVCLLALAAFLAGYWLLAHRKRS